MLEFETNGKFGKTFFLNMLYHFLALKYNFKVKYLEADKFSKLGINFFQGSRNVSKSDMKQIQLTDNNFLNYIINDSYHSLPVENIYFTLKHDTYAQTRTFALIIRDYVQTNWKLKIIHNNTYKFRYSDNNDVFLHVRLGDVTHYNPGFDYYDKILSNLDFKYGYISSDSINHPICLKLIEKYKLIKIETDEISTIAFASTCKNLILSNGTFSWLVGILAFQSNVFYPKIKYQWHGDIFVFPDWIEVDY